MSHYNSKKRKILKSTNIDHCQYPNCRHHHHLHLRMGGGVEKGETMAMVEAMHRMKNCYFASARSSYTWSSSSTPWIVSAVSTAPYPFRGTHTAPRTSYRPPRAASAPTRSVHVDLIMDDLHIGPNRSSSKHRTWRI